MEFQCGEKCHIFKKEGENISPPVFFLPVQITEGTRWNPVEPITEWVIKRWQNTEKNEGILLHFSASISDLTFVCHNLYSTWMAFLNVNLKTQFLNWLAAVLKGKICHRPKQPQQREDNSRAKPQRLLSCYVLKPQMMTFTPRAMNLGDFIRLERGFFFLVVAIEHR